MDVDFEKEVLIRLKVIEEKLESLEKTKCLTYDNRSDLEMVDKRITDIEKQLKAVYTTITTIIIGVATAALIYLLKI